MNDFDARDRRSDKVFAVNVNVFWTTPATDELARVREALAPGGTLYLFYETPGSKRAREAATRVVEALHANGSYRARDPHTGREPGLRVSRPR